jgi:Na+-driven multidrug efflux pump
MWWTKLPLRFVLIFVLFWGVGALAYGVLFGLRRTGVHRFSNVTPWTRSQ